MSNLFRVDSLFLYFLTKTNDKWLSEKIHMTEVKKMTFVCVIANIGNTK